MGVVVDTQQGKLEGIEEAGVQVFRGIPFARAPVGPLRFRPPEPAEPWDGVREARHFGSSAPQDLRQLVGFAKMGVGPESEDCLYLNVYTPGCGSDRRPVMVWIHGGAFRIGSGSQSMYHGHALVRRGDVVIVAINYRLGCLGFLHLEELVGESFSSSGNCGLLDQIAALHWVRENIAAFGGDPSNVTIFGESAGGMSVGTLLGTPGAAGLFTRAIAQSGACSHVSRAEDATGVAKIFLEEVGIEPRSGEALRGVPLDRLQAAQTRCTARASSPLVDLIFQPVIDRRVLPQSPEDAVREGLSSGVDLLLGTTRDEWSFWTLGDAALRDLDESGLRERVSERLPQRIPAARRAELTERLIAVYRNVHGDQPRGKLFTALQTDRIFTLPAIQLADAQTRHSSRTYRYMLTWESPAAKGALGACHGIDIPFVFGMIGRPGVERFAGEGPEAEALQDRIMDAWIQFARTGDPNHPGLPRWDAYESERRATMRLGPECALDLRPGEVERLAWLEVTGAGGEATGSSCPAPS